MKADEHSICFWISAILLVIVLCVTYPYFVERQRRQMERPYTTHFPVDNIQRDVNGNPTGVWVIENGWWVVKPISEIRELGFTIK